MIRITIDKTQESNDLISDVTYIQNFEDLNDREQEEFRDIYSKCIIIKDLTDLIELLTEATESSSIDEELYMKLGKAARTVMENFDNSDMLSDIMSFAYNRIALEINKLSRDLVPVHDDITYEGEMTMEQVEQIFGKDSEYDDEFDYEKSVEPTTEVDDDIFITGMEVGGGGSTIESETTTASTED